MHEPFRKMRFLLCLIVVMALAAFSLPPSQAVAHTGQPVVEVATLQEAEALVFTPPVMGVSAFATTRAPASNFAAYLAETSGVAVATFVTTDYGNTLRGIEVGKYDIVYLPAPLYVKAAAEFGVTPGYNVGVDGETAQTGQIVVAADSDVTELADLAGKVIGAANLDSAAAWTLPAAALMEAGVNPFRDIDAKFTGSDAESIIGVLNGELAAAFVLAGALENEEVLEADPAAAENLTVLAEYADVPIGVIAFRAGIDGGEQEAIMTALGAPEIAEAVDEEGGSLLGGLGWDTLVPAMDSDYADVYAAAAALGMIPESAIPTAAPAESAAPETEEMEALVFTPPVMGVSAFATTRAPASNFAAYLAETSGVAVATFVTTDYGNTLRGIEVGKYDIVYLPAPLYVKAAAEFGVTPGYNVGVDGETAQTGQIVVAADSDVTELADLAGKVIGAANLDSAAAWTLPAAALMEAGVNPFRDIDAKFTGSDAESIIGVLNGELAAAFVLAGALENEEVLEADPAAAENLTVLAEYADVPIGVIAFRAGIDGGEQEAIMTALGAPEIAEAVDEEGGSLLGGLGWDTLVPAMDSDYADVYAAAAALGMIPESAVPTAAPAESAAPETEEMEALVFTPPVMGVSAFATTRAPASNFAAYLAETSGVAVATFVTTDYGNTLRGIEVGKYDIVYLPAPLYVKAAAEFGVTPGYNVGVDGETAQTGQIVVAADSDVTELADLAGKVIGAANLDSAAAWTLPAAALMEAGVNPFRDIDAKFTGSDAESIIGVLNGELAAAFVLAGALENEEVLEADPAAAENLTVLAEYADVPIGVIAFRAGIDGGEQEAIMTALGAPEIAEAVDEEGGSLLGGLGWDTLVPAMDSDYADVYAAAAALGMIPESAIPTAAPAE